MVNDNVFEYHHLPSRDLELFTEADYNFLIERLVEVKKMIRAFSDRRG